MLPVGCGQVRRPAQLPVLTMVCGYSRWLMGVLIPTRAAADLFAGWWQPRAQRRAADLGIPSRVSLRVADTGD